MNGLPDFCKICGYSIFKKKDGSWGHANQAGEKAAEKDGHEAEGPEEEGE
ncbi:MAG: hypothetical protein V1897_19855 [Pseudomonadota bacterium]